MLIPNQYVPILKWKRGEQIGLQNCSDYVKDRITPLLEIPPVPWNFTEDRPQRTFENHIGGTADAIVQAFGTTRRFFLDTIQVAEDPSTDQVLVNLTRECLDKGLNVVPVVYPLIGDPVLTSLKDVATEGEKGICLRVFQNMMEDQNVFRSIVEQILNTLQMNKDKVDLIVDLGYQGQSIHRLFLQTILNNIVYDHNQWRSFTLACTSFPENMSDIDRDSIEYLKRIEWEAWEGLFASYQDGKLERMPSFGDYSVTNPAYPILDPRTINPSGHIRYTIDDDYMIVKGGAVRDVRRSGNVLSEGRTYGQMVDLCRALISQSEFRGRDFSWADQYIEDCANGQASSGNAETWIRVGTNHHLTFVAQQLANYPLP